ncbi:MAG: VOC family protein, partial [Alphaproteobacteria bacterium]|nr:VOC family protein [Alphaproteobacteria bacterium]
VCRTIGAGPFFVLENIELSHCLYRGEEAELDHTSAYGQAGDVMMEILQQNNTGPSAFRDMYGPEEHGLHHMATFSTDFDGEIKRYEEAGFEAANIATTSGGTRFAYIDTRSLFGHMTEFYEDDKGVRDFYAMVKAASEGWDGSDPIRVLG